MKLAILISSLRSGGAERAASTMANYWARKGWSLSVLTLSGCDTPPFYELDPSVLHVPLGLELVSSNPIAGLARNIRRVLVIRKTLVRIAPDVVISFMASTNLLTLMASPRLQIPIVVSVRSNPSSDHLDPFRTLARDRLYQMADAVVVQTERAKRFFSPSIRARTHVIPNPVLPAPRLATSQDELKVPRPAIVAVGRLSKEKGFDLLLEAFSGIRDRFSPWHLVVVGDGPLRVELEDQVRRLGLRGRVSFVGRVKHPELLMQQSDLFVLPSRFEGFPNALCEAMAAGLPAISFDCRNGPREIIRDGVDGLLVPPEDVGALTEAMARLMASEDERKRLAARAPEVIERFAVERVMDRWEQLLKSIVGARPANSGHPSLRV